LYVKSLIFHYNEAFLLTPKAASEQLGHWLTRFHGLFALPRSFNKMAHSKTSLRDAVITAEVLL